MARSKVGKVGEIAIVLEEAILSGELPPGTVLRQEQLSADFAVSRTPVREALRELAARGLVTFERHRGARVRSVSRSELEETYLVRAELEGLAAQLAAERITPTQLARLARAERRFAELTHLLSEFKGFETELQSLTAEWLRANDAFHDAILDAAHAPFLEQMAKSTRRIFQTHTVWWPSATIEHFYETNVEHHRAILEALRARDPKARALMAEHVLYSGRLVDELLKEASDRVSSAGPRGGSRLAGAPAAGA